MFLRLFLIFLAGLVLRRVFKQVFSSKSKIRRPSSRPADQSRSANDQDQSLENLTQQDVSDADFEEIP